eukprot:2615402-Amphidinium_carterae.1
MTTAGHLAILDLVTSNESHAEAFADSLVLPFLNRRRQWSQRACTNSTQTQRSIFAPRPLLAPLSPMMQMEETSKLGA